MLSRPPIYWPRRRQHQHRTASHHDATHEHRYTDGSQHLLPYRLQRKQTPAYRQRQYQQEPEQIGPPCVCLIDHPHDGHNDGHLCHQQFRRYTSFIGTTNQQKPLVDPTGSRRFVCVGITPGQNIDFEDNLYHEQLFAQVLHLFNNGEHYWLDNAEIATLIKENEPYQKLNDLVEMIGETFRKPKSTEQVRWWTLPEIHEFLKSRFTNYDPKTSYEKLGRALSNLQFDFESDRKSSGHIYKLMEI